MAPKRTIRHKHRRTSAPNRSPAYRLKLYIAGMSTRSVSAIHSIRSVCEEYLRGQYELEVVDLYRHPARAREEQIVAAPTLIKKMPAPMRRLVGDMSDKSRILAGLAVKRK